MKRERRIHIPGWMVVVVKEGGVTGLEEAEDEKIRGAGVTGSKWKVRVEAERVELHRV